jgi:hypothetical protein
LRKRIVQTKPILMFYKQQTKQIKHTLYAKEIIQSNQISPSISEARAYLPDQSLAPVMPRTYAPLALQAHAALAPPHQSMRRPCASMPEPTESLTPAEPRTHTELSAHVRRASHTRGAAQPYCCKPAPPCASTPQPASPLRPKRCKPAPARPHPRHP